jgi:hypothetical protein
MSLHTLTFTQCLAHYFPAENNERYINMQFEQITQKQHNFVSSKILFLTRVSEIIDPVAHNAAKIF